MRPMRVLQVSAELFPLLKTGGLADVTGALPAALQAAGQDVRALLPGFPAIVAGLRGSAPAAEFDAPWGEPVRLHLAHLPAATHGAPALAVYWIEAPDLYDRPGNPYEDAAHQAYDDNHRRFALLGWAGAQLAQGLDPAWQPDIVHAHDWHAALAPAYLAFAPRQPRAPRVGSVFTVHNLAYQGLFAPWHLHELGLPPAAFQMNGLEFHGQLSFMKGGLCFADRLTTVSPTYAREIQTPEQGRGLDGLLRSRAEVLSGILNGVDDRVWNPADDRHLPEGFAPRRTAGKTRCKAALQAELGLAAQAEAPLFIVVSRLTEQKGLHLVLAGLDDLLAQGGQLALLGSGDAWLEAAFRERATAAPRQISVTLGYDEPLAHRLFGAGDVTLVPSAFEPCGLTQMYGLRYGSLPLVHRVGGLADTVTDCTLEDMAAGTATGFVFDHFEQPAYARAVRRAFALFRRPADWRAVRAAAMRRPADWGQAAARYVALYQQVLAA